MKGRPTHGSKVELVQFGKYEINTWFTAPYIEEGYQTKLFICEFCLKCLSSSAVYLRHKLKCTLKRPPGDEIYHKNGLSVYEVDGRKSTVNY